MIDALEEKTCTPCMGGIPPLSEEEAERFLARAPVASAFRWPSSKYAPRLCD
jgi:hypothetical protein